MPWNDIKQVTARHKSDAHQSVPLVAALFMETRAPDVAPMSYPNRRPPRAGKRKANPVMDQSIGC